MLVFEWFPQIQFPLAIRYTGWSINSVLIRHLGTRFKVAIILIEPGPLRLCWDIFGPSCRIINEFLFFEEYLLLLFSETSLSFFSVRVHDKALQLRAMASLKQIPINADNHNSTMQQNQNKTAAGGRELNHSYQNPSFQFDQPNNVEGTHVLEITNETNNISNSLSNGKISAISNGDLHSQDSTSRQSSRQTTITTLECVEEVADGENMTNAAPRHVQPHIVRQDTPTLEQTPPQSATNEKTEKIDARSVESSEEGGKVGILANAEPSN
jgi:hypothetical protein